MRTPVIVHVFLAVALLGVLAAARPAPAPPTEDREGARAAFALLNRVRQNPGAFSTQMGVNLNNVRPRPALVWNDTLYTVALARATDMARRRYFEHVNPDGLGSNILMHRAGYTLPDDWIKPKNKYYFESLAAGDSSATAAIQVLIEDEGFSTPTHRHHLLGIEDFWANCPDGAIAHVRCPECPYPSYTVVLIAKQGF